MTHAQIPAPSSLLSECAEHSACKCGWVQEKCGPMDAAYEEHTRTAPAPEPPPIPDHVYPSWEDTFPGTCRACVNCGEVNEGYPSPECPYLTIHRGWSNDVDLKWAIGARNLIAEVLRTAVPTGRKSALIKANNAVRTLAEHGYLR